MTDILFFIISLATLLYHAWYVKQHDKEVKTLTKALMSKNLKDFTESEVREEQIKKKPEKKIKNDDFIEVKDLSDDQFDKMIQKQIKGE